MRSRTRPEKPTVLVVDELASEASPWVAALGEEVVASLASSADGALRAAAERRPALILLDAALASEGGEIRLPAWLAADPATLGVPVILASADAAAEARALVAGAVDFVVKPLRPEVLRARVRRHLEAAELRRDLDEARSRVRALEADAERAGQRERRLRLILDNVRDTLWTADVAEERFTYVSPSVLELRGYTAVELIGQPISATLTPESLASVRRYLAAALPIYEASTASWPAHTSEVDQPRKDGSIVQTEATTTFIRSEAGRVELLGVSRDVTERKAAEARRRAYFETPAVGIAITSPTKGWLEVNDHLCSMLGYAREELTRATWVELTHPDDVAADVGQFERVMNGELDSYALDKRFLRKDGTILWTLLSVSCVRRPDRTVDCFVSICMDIGRRKAAEEALTKSEALMSRVLEGTSDGFGDFDARTGRIAVTARYGEIHGLAPGTTETTVEAVMASVEPADLECIRGDMEAIAAGTKDSHVWEYRVRREDGSTRWIQSRGKVAGRDASGTPVHVSGSITDIHDRKVAEGALRQSEERFRRLFHEHSAVKLIVDPATGQICDANKAAVAFYGWPLDELKAMRMQQINTLPPGQLASALESARDGRQTQFEFRHRRADGSERDVEVFSNVIELDGRAQVYSIVHDVTERRLAEEEKERVAAENRQLLKAESLGRMAAAIAHHFNNQLQSVLAHLELAMEDPSDEPRGREDLQAAAAAARKAAELSRLMRTYMGHDLGDRRPADLSDACVQALAAVGSRADAGASLHVDLQSPGPCVFANPRQLEQLVDHLVTNGLEALRGGPREILVSVATLSAADIPHARRFPVDFRPEGGAYACLEVADSGCGVPEQDLERIFDPFFSTKLLGRGLGLAVVIGIVRSLQGAVVVAPRPQGGTSFRVFLPVLASEVAHAQAPRRAGSMAPNPVTADVFGRYLEALCAGDRAACHQTVTALLERGVTGRTLGGDLFRASLQEVGVRWERGLIDVATEHRATAITEELLAVAFPSAGARARNGRRALVSCAANERHQLGGRIVSLVMEQRGWDVSFLGANGSIDALVALVASVRPGLVGLSLSVASHLDEALGSVEAVRAAGHAMPVVLGGEAVYGLAPGRLARWTDVHAIPTLEEFEERLPTWERG